MVKHATGLIGLPDIGDPFDVAAFRLFRVPEDQDAIVLARKAAVKVQVMPNLPVAARRLGPSAGWSNADPALRDWVMKNREALQLFAQAALRADGVANPAREWRDNFAFLDLRSLVWLALLEGARLEEQGDMAGAWGWYQTVYRMKVLVMRRGSIVQRHYADSFASALQTRVVDWAANGKTDVALLRKALDGVRAGEPKPEWYSFSLKIDYMIMVSELDRPGSMVQQSSLADLPLPFNPMLLPPDIKSSINAGAGLSSTSPSGAVACFALPLLTGWRTCRNQKRRIAGPRYGQRFSASGKTRACFSMRSPPVRPTAHVGCRRKTWQAG